MKQRSRTPAPREHRIAALWAIAAGCALLLAPRAASSLPLYSRALGVSCANCHDFVPHLNAAGMAFAQHGHLIAAHPAEGSESSNAVPFSAVGSVGLGDMRTEPARASDGEGLLHGTTRSSFSSFELVAAGSPAPRLYAHLEAGLDHEGPNVRRGDEFVQYGDAGPSGSIALKAGRFDAALPFLSNDPRLTVATYLTPVAFAARGFELDGSHAAWNAAAGLSMSDRTLAGGVRPHAISPPLEDMYLQLGRRFGAQSLAAQMLFDRQDSHLATLSWLQHMRCQVAAQLAYPGVTFVPAYVFDRFDDRPMPGVHERHQYYMIEGIVPLLASRWVMTARYEHDYRTRNTYDPEDHRQQEVVQLTWQAIPNARLGLECARTDDRVAHTGNADLQAFAQASW
jgi:hypothetical protein